jgi:hypothetical protein
VVGKPRLGPAQVLVHDSRHPGGGDAGVFRLALSISDLSPSPSLLGAHGFNIGDKGGRGPRPRATYGGRRRRRGRRLQRRRRTGRAQARGDGIIIVGVITTWGGRCPLSIGAAVAEAAAGEAEGARMTVAGRTTTSQMWPSRMAAAGTSCGGRSRVNSLRTSSGERKRQWVRNDYKFEDALDPTTAAADGNEDYGESDSDDDDDRRTSSALISL